MGYSGELKVFFFFFPTARRRKPVIIHRRVSRTFIRDSLSTCLCPSLQLPASIVLSFILTSHFPVLRTPVSSSPLHLCLCGSFSLAPFPTFLYQVSWEPFFLSLERTHFQSCCMDYFQVVLNGLFGTRAFPLF